MATPINHGQAWTPQDDKKLRRLYFEGHDFSNIASMLERSEYAISCRVKLLCGEGSTEEAAPKEAAFLETVTTTVTYLQGRDISKYSEQALWQLIADEEERGERLNAIKHQPESLKKEVVKIFENLVVLVTYMDNRNKGE